jgi:predicted hydrocarbon binding protein
MIEDKYGFDISDEVIVSSGLDGIYSQAGNYPVTQMFQLVDSLSKLINVSSQEIVYMYGKYLFKILIKIYPLSVEKYKNSFEFISNVEDIIHPEVKKLYPDSELPNFEIIIFNDKELKIMYKSTKPLMELAKGLMVGCANYYDEDIDISYTQQNMDSDLYNALFILKK